MINIDFDKEILTLGRIMLYVLDKNNKVIYKDFSLSGLERFEKDIRRILSYMSSKEEVLSCNKISEQEYHFHIKNSDNKIAIVIGFCMMTKKEYSNLKPGENCIGEVISRMSST